MKKAAYIDPIIGTIGDEQEMAQSAHGGGKTHPGACTPGGMVQLSPDTVTGGDNGTGYNYCHNTIEGFSFNHMSGIGWYGDLGNLQIMPVVGDTDLRSGSNEEVPFNNGTTGWKSEFSHEREHARAGYYSVVLDRYDILAEATVTEHTGMLRLTYPERSDARAIFNFSRRIAGQSDFQQIEIIDNRRIEGYIKCTHAGGGFGRGDGGIDYNLYFACELSVDAENMQFFSNEEYAEPGLKYFEGEDAGLVVRFGSGAEQPVVLRCGISYVDVQGARNNLECECDSFDFDAVAERAFDAWEQALGSVEVQGDDETDLKLFYTCLYHALLDPRTAMDADGRFAMGDEAIMTADYTHRTMFSGWDVFRSEFPLLTVIRPDVVNDEVNSLLRIAEYRNISFPRWELMGADSKCMTGDPGLLVAADAYIKGIRSFDANKTYDISVASSKAYTTLWGKPFTSLRPGFDQYQKDAFVPGWIGSTLEYLAADFAMAQFAKAMGKDEDARYFEQRSKRYGENYNPELGFMVSRNPDGSFIQVKDEFEDVGCIESNILQQSMFVPHDVEGLAELFGKERLLGILEDLFAKADLSAMWNIYYNHSNEPCHNVTHYFSILGKPDRTQYWTRRVQKEAYRTGACGFCGNEDVGQLSAWYVLSAIGFAQVCMADERFYVNTPLFEKICVRLNPEYHSCSVADTLTIECDKNPLEYGYIRAMHLNGEKIERTYLTFAEITSGGVLNFELSAEPC